MIADYFATYGDARDLRRSGELGMTVNIERELRYGENPHQSAQLCSLGSDRTGLLAAEIHQGKELSYNNFLDLDAALQLCSELSDGTTAVIVKHTNPCGAASLANAKLSDVYQKALACDPVSAFGGIIALNKEVDEATARLLAELFVECIAAPSYSASARGVFAAKKNLRILSVDVAAYAKNQGPQLRSLAHGLLLQSADSAITASSTWKAVTNATADAKRLHDLKFAMTVAKHVKSNAIVLAKDGATIGVGAGQMSRIDALECAVKKARSFNLDLNGSCLASDAFFPFRDCVDESAKAGVRYIVQPGGSVRDQESVDACNEHSIAMYLNGERHFRH
jgi:phosphoribosylaminoimidazolecarboxamide formyltransferase/IMP cyclohydrolase